MPHGLHFVPGEYRLIASDSAGISSTQGSRRIAPHVPSARAELLLGQEVLRLAAETLSAELNRSYDSVD